MTAETYFCYYRSTVPVNNFVESAIGGTQVEGCNITHSRDTGDNTENLKKKVTYGIRFLDQLQILRSSR